MNLTFNECKVLKANGFIPEGEEEVFFKGTYNKEDDAFFFNLKEPNQDIYISNCEYKERI